MPQALCLRLLPLERQDMPLKYASLIYRHVVSYNDTMKYRQQCETCGEWFERKRPPAVVKRHGGPPRFCTRACAGVARRGERHPKFKGEWIAMQKGQLRAFVWAD